MNLKLNEFEKQKLEKFLYEEGNKSNCIEFLKTTNNNIFLHLFAENYNWDDGLEIPIIIAKNKNSDLGTALFLFFNAEGEFLLNYNNLSEIEKELMDEDEDWKTLLTHLYKKITNDEYKNKMISYDPGWSKLDKYKLLKKNPNIPNVFLVASPGEVIQRN